MKKYTDVIFDLDNTLWDFRKNSKAALEKLFKAYDIHTLYSVSFETFHSAYYPINEQLWADLRDEKIDKDYLRKHRFLDSFTSVGIDNTQLATQFEDQYLNVVTNFNFLVDGTLEILKYLFPKYHLHILSNGFEEVTHRKINQSGLFKYFQTITSADEIGKRKPNPEVFTYCLSKFQGKKENTIFVGDDWFADGIGAYNFGLTSVFLNILEENFKHPKIIEIKQLSHLQNIL